MNHKARQKSDLTLLNHQRGYKVLLPPAPCLLLETRPMNRRLTQSQTDPCIAQSLPWLIFITTPSLATKPKQLTVAMNLSAPPPAPYYRCTPTTASLTPMHPSMSSSHVILMRHHITTCNIYLL
ncbi:hypothetical protein E2C01_010373 [Portunus trituberculatus]|uniref:Uncharacterized protein n=1 Tax=Portunus trituberculatus TaxID=210409 RepID=A0A5B7D8A1_PORTR|nr:hypothetical protein [Portunus trituberculatus]